MSGEDLQVLAAELDEYGLTSFVNENYRYLYEHTSNVQAFGSELLKRKILFMRSQLDTCLQHAADYNKNEALYNHIQQKNECLVYLQVLKESGNESLIKYIRKQLPTKSSSQSGSTPPNQPPPTVTGSSSVPPTLANANEPAPTTEKGKNVTHRLQSHMRDLKAQDFDPPFFHFVRPHLTELYENTQNYDQLILFLTQYDVFTDYGARRIKAIPEWNVLDRGAAVYDAIKVQGVSVIPKLIKAFEKTGNGNVINDFDQWLKNVGF